MNRYEIILWDVDQTLLDFNKSMNYALRHTFQSFGLPISDDIVNRYAQINISYWKKLELGLVTKQELLIGRFQDLINELSIQHMVSAKQIQEVYQIALGSVYYYLDDSFTLCKKLQSEVRQFVVSNGVLKTQRNKMKISGFDQIMENIFISDDIGFSKPDKNFFEECFKRIPDFKVEKTLLIGDSLSSDMKGANASGLTCCWYNPSKETPPDHLRIDYEITNLWEVEDIIHGKISKSKM